MAPKKEKQTTALANYDAEFAAFAKDISARLAAGGMFVSFKSGLISIAGKPTTGNKLKVIIMDQIHENAYYAGAYSDDDKSPPTCFALGRDKDEMYAHPNAKAHWQNAQPLLDAEGKEQKGPDGKLLTHSPCNGCPMNVMGTANNGSGKACGNKVRLALLSAENLDVESVKNGEILYAKLSVMNVRPFALYTKGLNEGFKRPPFGVITTIGAVPDPKSQFKVTFQMEELVPKELSAAVIARHNLEEANTGFPYPAASDAPAKPQGKAAAKGAKSKPAAAGARKKKF